MVDNLVVVTLLYSLIPTRISVFSLDIASIVFKHLQTFSLRPPKTARYLVNHSLSLTFLSVCVIRFVNILYLLQIEDNICNQGIFELQFEDNICNQGIFLVQDNANICILGIFQIYGGYFKFMGDISSLWGYFELSSSHFAL